MYRYFCVLLLASPSLANDNNNEQEGSLNTSNIDSTVSSNNVSEDRSVSNTYNGAGSSKGMPPPSAIAPSYMSNGLENCLKGNGSSIQTNVLGWTRGGYKLDEECNRRRDAKTLSDLGMKVAAIARMCEDEIVWKSMFLSGTPCPIQKQGRLVVGKRAFLLMKSNPTLYIPEYGDIGKKLTDTQLWYNSVLGIGVESDEETIDNISVSDKFRSSSEPAR